MKKNSFSVFLSTGDEALRADVRTLIERIPDRRFAFVDRPAGSHFEAAGIDIAMVDLDNPSTDALTRETCESAGIPIVMLAGSTDAEREREAMEKGAIDMVAKGNLTAAVLERILQHAGRIRQANRRLLGRERHLAAIIEAFDGFISICSPEHRIEYMNDRLLRRSGCNGRGQRCHHIYHNLPDVCPWCSHEQVFAGQTVRHEIQSPKDGRWYFVVDTPVLWEDDYVAKLSMVQDITERKMGEVALRKSEERYRSLVENIQLGIVMIGAGHQVIMINGAMGRLIGKTADEVVGRSCHQAIWGREAPCRGCPGEQAMATGQSVSAEVVKEIGGRRRCLRVRAFPTFDDKGGVSGFVEVFDDVTELWLAESELRRLNEDLERQVAHRTRDLELANMSLLNEVGERRQLEDSLRREKEQLETAQRELAGAYAELQATQARVLQQEKMASIGQLAAGVAHEINNPMGFITSNLNSLVKFVGRLDEFLAAQSAAVAAAVPEEMERLQELRRKMKIDYILSDLRQLIRESLDGADRVRKIVQDLKTFSRRDDGQCRPADLVDCLETTINMVWNELKYKAVIEKDLAEVPPALCNPQQMNQVFMNLLLNASQAIEKNGTIRIRSWHEGSKVHVAVADDGCGIAPEVLPRLFEPFFTTKPVGQGTGLGLSISYEIVRDHGGDIQVESVPGRGTTFVVSLPVAGGYGHE